MKKTVKSNTPKITVAGFKGFDKDMKCLGMQYAIGETFTHDGKAKLCSSGLHFCEYPLDVLGYYEPGTGSRYAEVEASDVAAGKEDGGDSKRVAKSLHVKAEISFSVLGGLAAKFIMDRADFTNKKVHQKTPCSVASNSGDSSVASNSGHSSVASNSGDRSVASNSGHSSVASNSGYNSVASNSGYRSVASNSGDSSVASNSGYSSVASNSGDSSVASNSGYMSVASNSGEKSCAVSLGIEATAKAALGCWLTLSEWEYRNSDFHWHRIDVQTRKVDGKKVKADTLYKLVGGKFVEVTE